MPRAGQQDTQDMKNDQTEGDIRERGVHLSHSSLFAFSALACLSFVSIIISTL